MAWGGTSRSWVMMGGQRWARLWALGSEPLYWTRWLCDRNPRPRGLCSECPSHLVMLERRWGRHVPCPHKHVLGASELVTAERCGGA